LARRRAGSERDANVPEAQGGMPGQRLRRASTAGWRTRSQVPTRFAVTQARPGAADKTQAPRRENRDFANMIRQPSAYIIESLDISATVWWRKRYSGW